MGLPNRESRIVLAETDYLRLVQEGHWTYAQRTRTTGAIAVIAITDDCQIVLVEQYRIPVANSVIELPAGLVGDERGFESETLIDAARRELMEETGFAASRMWVVTKGASSAGLTDERVHLLMATGLQRTGSGGGCGSEEIRVHCVPLVQTPTWLQEQQQRGLDVDFKVFAGLYIAERELGAQRVS